MPIIVSYTKKEYTPTPEGLQQCVCVDVVDLGLEDGKWGKKHKVSLRWQSEHMNTEGEKPVPFLIVMKYTMSLHEKAILRQHLDSWRGQNFTPEELDSFDLEKLIGANCQIQIIHHIAEEGRVWANIQAIVPQGKNTEKLIPMDYIRIQDREDAPPTAESAASEEDDDSLPF